MTRPSPARVFHFTRVEHLPAIIEHGLLSDNEAQARGLLDFEVGNVGIKDRRRTRPVPVEPAGYVADYVPFYYAPRSPMMFSIHKGNVETYQDGCGRLVYLVSSLEQLVDHNLDVVVTDRNAVLGFADFQRFEGELDDDFVDWSVMKLRIWRNTTAEPDRVERRMAECLVHREVPWSAIGGIATMDEGVAEEARAMLAVAGVENIVKAKRDWYF